MRVRVRISRDSLTLFGDNIRNVVAPLVDCLIVCDEHEAIPGNEGEGVVAGRALESDQR